MKARRLYYCPEAGTHVGGVAHGTHDEIRNNPYQRAT